MVPQLLIKRVSDACPPELKLLSGLVLEAKLFGPFEDLPPLPKGGSMTINVVCGFCPPACDVRSAWVIETIEIFRALKESGQKLEAFRFKKHYGSDAFAQGSVVAIPVNDPRFDVLEVA